MRPTVGQDPMLGQFILIRGKLIRSVSHWVGCHSVSTVEEYIVTIQQRNTIRFCAKILH